MTHHRLRYLDRVIELLPGEFIVGRSSSCHLQLDDPAVSRRHAVLRVGPAGVTVEDGGSRNGVFLNGTIVRMPTKVREGDRIEVGEAELVLQVSDGQTDTREVPEPIRLVKMGEDDPESVFGQTQNLTAPSSLLLDVADKSLSLGRVEDAEWILGKFIDDIDSRLAGGHPVGPDTIEKTARHAIKVAAATHGTDWIDWVFDVYRVCGRLLPAVLIDELHSVVRRVRYPASAALCSYVESMQASGERLGAAEKFLLQRLEGLLEVASAN